MATDISIGLYPCQTEMAICVPSQPRDSHDF